MSQESKEDSKTPRPHLIRNCRLSESAQQKDMLLMPEGVLQLKGSGAAILKLCDGKRSIGEILILLRAQFPEVEKEKLEAETRHFLQQMRDKRVMDF